MKPYQLSLASLTTTKGFIGRAMHLSSCARGWGRPRHFFLFPLPGRFLRLRDQQEALESLSLWSLAQSDPIRPGAAATPDTSFSMRRTWRGDPPGRGSRSANLN